MNENLGLLRIRHTILLKHEKTATKNHIDVINKLYEMKSFNVLEFTNELKKV